MRLKKVNLGIANSKGKEFNVSKMYIDSFFTKSFLNAIGNKDFDFYLISEIKGTLDIEGEGSSRKIIQELVSGKRSPKNDNEQKAINLYSVMSFIEHTKPAMNKENLMIIFNMLKMNINMGDNELENPMSYRQSTEEGFIGKFKTPLIPVLNKGMEDLFKFINSDLLEESKLEKALLIQIIFIYFHPFYDFNGRTGRLMSYWYLMNNNKKTLANSIYLALPENKKKYIKMWEALRKFSWNDLTTFLNFLKGVTAYGINKLIAIDSISQKEGLVFNSSEKLLLFYLISTKDWILVNDLMVKIDLGISKQGIHNAINSLSNKGVVEIKKVQNKSLVRSKQVLMDVKFLHQQIFNKFSKDMSKSDISLEESK